MIGFTQRRKEGKEDAKGLSPTAMIVLVAAAETARLAPERGFASSASSLRLASFLRVSA
jgi:hypothetical protein